MPKDASERCGLDDVRDILGTIGLHRFYNTFVAAGIYDELSLRKKASTLLKSQHDHDLLNAYFHLQDRVDAERTTREQTVRLLQETAMKIRHLEERKEAIMANSAQSPELLHDQLSILLEEINASTQTMQHAKNVLAALDDQQREKQRRTAQTKNHRDGDSRGNPPGGEEEKLPPPPPANYGFHGSKVRRRPAHYADPSCPPSSSSMDAGVKKGGPGLRGMRACPVTLGVSGNVFDDDVQLRCGAFHQSSTDHANLFQSTTSTPAAAPRVNSPRPSGPAWNRGTPRMRPSPTVSRRDIPQRMGPLSISGQTASHGALGVSYGRAHSAQMKMGCVKV